MAQVQQDVSPLVGGSGPTSTADPVPWS